jgi:NAD(P)-dependent dehydrogenase (short-subunit alcohol dehydrogenase family)
MRDKIDPKTMNGLYEKTNQHDLDRLEDKTAVVTGSTRGIGEGIARRFASEGANVAICGRSTDQGEAVATAIQADGGNAKFIHTDLSNPEEIKNLVEETVHEYGDIDIIVNNAAAWRHGAFADRGLDDWQVVVDVSLRAPWLLVKYAMNYLSTGGDVINISSVHGLATEPGKFPYNMAKAGLDGMTRALAVELTPVGITVNGIRPGAVRISEPIEFDGGPMERYSTLSPARRCGIPEDIAAIAAFLATDESNFITGETITVDGGWTASLLHDLDAYDI